jgi:hypothetical protein
MYGDITFDFLYCNHQVHRYFLITLYIKEIVLLSSRNVAMTDPLGMLGHILITNLQG